MVHITLSQIECDNCRSVFDGRANKGVLVHLRDSRLKLHLHCNRHPSLFLMTDLPVDKSCTTRRAGSLMKAPRGGQ